MLQLRPRYGASSRVRVTQPRTIQYLGPRTRVAGVTGAHAIYERTLVTFGAGGYVRVRSSVNRATGTTVVGFIRIIHGQSTVRRLVHE